MLMRPRGESLQDTLLRIYRESESNFNDAVARLAIQCGREGDLMLSVCARAMAGALEDGRQRTLLNEHSTEGVLM
jgi:hypothetical protein